LDNSKKFPKLNFACQNVCSLNISKPNKKTHSKIITVTKTGADIIFLSDTRLNSDKQIAGVNDIVKKIRFMGYSFYHDSRKNSRGVAVLLSNRINYAIKDTFCDENCNMLLQKLVIGNISITLGSIYGPNDDDENFFNQLEHGIDMFNSDFVILGGDWNATYDIRNNRHNLDFLNTIGIPSVRRSAWLNRLCTRKSLEDPYRYFYPENKEFTYVPFAANATNRSRLDFYIVSSSVLPDCVNCRIPHSLSTTMFDHKTVTLIFRRDNPYKKQVIDDRILKCPDINDVVDIAVLECYINHLIPTETLSDIDIDGLRLIIGRVCRMQKDLITYRLRDSEMGYDPQNNERIIETRNAIKNNLELLPSLDDLQNMEISCDKDTFLEILIMAVKNSSLAHQHSYFKVRNAKRIFRENKIKNLKKNFDANSGEILRAERDLNAIVESDAREEISKMKNFEHLNNEKITPYFLALAKKPHNSENLSEIVREDGVPFNNARERDIHIKNYFANTYKRVPDTVTNNSIPEFLGDVAENPMFWLLKSPMKNGWSWKDL
jgi:exonuclease III